MQNTANFHGLSNRGLQIGQNYGNVHLGSDTRDESTKHRDMAEEWRKILFITDPEVDRQQVKSAKGERVPGTCQWIIKHPKFTQWEKEDHGSLLWICGGPGKGKTMISIFLTEWLELVKRKNNTHVLYFFCDHRQNTRNSDRAILRGLLIQLLRLQPSLQSHVSLRGDPENKFVNSRDALWLLWCAMLHDPNRQPVKCVIDGVDECNEDCFTWLCERVAGFYEQGMPEGSQPCHIMIVSRKGTPLRSWPTIDLDDITQDEVSSDVERFVNERTKSISNVLECTKSFETWVKHELLKRGERSFLWLGCVIQVLLRKMTCSDVETTLKAFPAGLGSLYDRLLLDIEQEHRSTCATILKWAVHAMTPITLLELAEILDIKESPIISVEQAVCDRIKWCGPLVRLETEDNKGAKDNNEMKDNKGTKCRVLPIHSSLSAYLTKSRKNDQSTLQLFKFDADETHLYIATTCLDYLKTSFAKGTKSWDCNNTDVQQKHPFMVYATKYLGDHASRAHSHARQLLTSHFNPEGFLLIQRWWGSYFYMAHPKSSAMMYEEVGGFKPEPAMHIAARFGILSFAENCIENARSIDEAKVLVNEKDVLGYTPLDHATYRNQFDFVCFLLHNGAVIVDLAVFVAASEGHSALLRLLLDSGGNVNAKSLIGDTAIYDAAGQGLDEIVQILLEYNADVNMLGTGADSALTIALMGGRESTVRMLLPKTHNVRGAPYFWEAFMNNMIEGRENMIRLITDCVPEATPDPFYERQILWWATSSTASPSILALILDRFRIDPNKIIKDLNPESWTWSLLDRSIETENMAILCYLLERGVEWDRQSELTSMMMNLAARKDHIQLMSLLLQRDALDTVVFKDGTALHVASWSGQKEIVHRLIKQGADLNATDSSGKTALMWAAKQGDPSIVRMLLQGGALTTVKNQHSQTELDVAREEGHKEVVTILEEHAKGRGKSFK
jgi:ankyrin repeat protein